MSVSSCLSKPETLFYGTVVTSDYIEAIPYDYNKKKPQIKCLASNPGSRFIK